MCQHDKSEHEDKPFHLFQPCIVDGCECEDFDEANWDDDEKEVEDAD